MIKNDDHDRENNGERNQEPEWGDHEMNPEEDTEIEEEFYERVDEVADEIEDLKGEIEDIIQEKIDQLRELIEEFKEAPEHKKFKHYQKIRNQLGKIQLQVETKTLKLEKYYPKLQALVAKYMIKQQRRRKPVERINISVPDEMSKEWRGWADDLSTSVSELIRTTMKMAKKGLDSVELKSIKDLDRIGENIEKGLVASGIEQLGEEIERKVKTLLKESGLDEFDIDIDPKSKDGRVKVKVHVDDRDKKKGRQYEEPKDIKIESGEETAAEWEPSLKEKAKKRIRGIIKLQHGIPVEKLANALAMSHEEAENLIYELAAEEGVFGQLEEGMFKFENEPGEIISILNRLIDDL